MKVRAVITQALLPLMAIALLVMTLALPSANAEEETPPQAATPPSAPPSVGPSRPQNPQDSGQTTPPRPSQYLSPTGLTGRLLRQYEKAVFKMSPKIVNGSWQHLEVGLDYRGVVEPAYIDGKQLREDHFILRAGVGTGDLIDSGKTPIGFNIRSGTELVFYRLFSGKTPTDAKNKATFTLPYFLQQVPSTAKIARERLVPGDSVRFISNLSFSIGAETLKEMSGTTQLTAGAHYIVSGDFLVDVFRLKNDRIRVRLIGIRDPKKFQVGFGVTYLKPWQAFEIKNAPSGINNAGHRLVNHIESHLNDLLDIEPLSIGYESARSSRVFMADYIFDLKDDEAASAYESLMHQNLRLDMNRFRWLNPRASANILEKKLISDLEPAEQIYANDKFKKFDQKRVDRIFQGFSISNTDAFNFRMAMGFGSFRFGRFYSKNKIGGLDVDGNPIYFLLYSVAETAERKFFWSLAGKAATGTLNILFQTNDKFKPQNFTDLIFQREIREVIFDSDDLKDFKREVKATIPEEWYKQIDWRNFNSQQDHRNTYLNYQIVFHEAALDAIPMMSKEALKKRIWAYLATLPKDYLNWVTASKPYLPGDEPSAAASSLDRFSQDVDLIADKLTITLDSSQKTSNFKRIDAFLSLRQNDLFKTVGPGLVLSLLPKDHLEDLLFFKLTLDGGATEKVNFSRGKEPLSKIYTALEQIQKILNDRSIDLRVMLDEHGGAQTFHFNQDPRQDCQSCL